ncbi:MAG: DUF2586 domain-containing protein [Eubacteriales bacterium]|nr:DUF2586 domain-containing protein [Eubacteriales bacterium]
MPLTDVIIGVQDGGLGVAPPAADGIHAKVGVCSAGTVGQIVAVSNATKAREAFGTGPLVNAILDAYTAAGGTGLIYAVRAGGDIDGVVGAVTAAKTGQGNMTAAGTPLDAYDVLVEIVDAGRLNVATFKYSLDGGRNWSGKITVPSAGAYTISGTGMIVTFAEYATDPDESFLVGDQYSFKTTAPQASAEKVVAAIDALLGFAYSYEYIHVTGDSDAAMWAALNVKALEAESKFRYLHILTEARGPAAETVDAWVNALVTAKASFASTRVAISAGRLRVLDAATGRQADRNGAGIYSGRLSSIRVRTSPAKVETGPLPGVLGLLPEGLDDGHIETLDTQGFITFRQYIGLRGYFVNEGRMSAELTSDYTVVERRRPMDKACHLVRLAFLQAKHAEIDPVPEKLELELRTLENSAEAALGPMIADGDISRATVVIPRDQDILATSKLKVQIRIVPMGTIREFEVNIGYENPFRGGAE